MNGCVYNMKYPSCERYFTRRKLHVFGEGCGDVVIRGGVNQAVKRLGRLFEPYLWERKK